MAHLHERQTGSKVLVAGRGRLLCVSLLQGHFSCLRFLQRLSMAHAHTLMHHPRIRGLSQTPKRYMQNLDRELRSG